MAEFERREAAGESVWTRMMSTEARVRLLSAFDIAIGDPRNTPAHARAERIVVLLRSFGLPIAIRQTPYNLRSVRMAIEDGPWDEVPSVIEASMEVLRRSDYDDRVKTVFEQERLAYRVVGRQLIPFDSLELHEEVVAPALRLLVGRPDLDEVESAYQDALKEIGGNPGNAITDAGRALQAMLTAIGCSGNAIGAQLKDARKQNLLAPHDPTLSAGIEKVIDWVSADRSEKGDAHKSVPVTTEDAWFTVHVVGALIVRLSEGSRTTG